MITLHFLLSIDSKVRFFKYLTKFVLRINFVYIHTFSIFLGKKKIYNLIVIYFIIYFPNNFLPTGKPTNTPLLCTTVITQSSLSYKLLPSKGSPSPIQFSRVRGRAARVDNRARAGSLRSSTHEGRTCHRSANQLYYTCSLRSACVYVIRLKRAQSHSRAGAYKHSVRGTREQTRG